MSLLRLFRLVPLRFAARAAHQVFGDEVFAGGSDRAVGPAKNPGKVTWREVQLRVGPQVRQYHAA
jgi:hypothetical protein